MIPRYFHLGVTYLGIAVVIFFFFSSPLPAQQIQTEQAIASRSYEKKAPVIIDGRVLFMVRGTSSYPAAERAQVVAGNIRKIAADNTLDVKNVRTEKEGEFVSLYFGKLKALSLAEPDAVSEGVSLDILTEITREKIKSAITQYRHDRTPRVLMLKTGYTLAATLLAALLVWGVLRLLALLDSFVQQRIKSHMERLESKSHRLIKAEMLLDIFSGGLNLVKIMAVIVIIYAYLNLTLGLYPWTRLFAQRLFAIILDPLRTIALGILSALPSMVFLVILFILIRYILKLTRLFFYGIELGRIRLANFEQEWALPTYKIVRLLIISFGAVVAYPYIPGSDSDAFKGISIFLGVIFSLGSSSVLAHIIAGYSLTYRRAFKVGDRVKINDLIGDIEDMSLLVTRMRSLKNEEVVMPNSVILNSNVVNYSAQERDKGLILHTTVGIGYEVPWRQVEAMLLLAAERTSGVKREPPPFVLQQSLGDFAVNYELNAYCEDASQMMRLYTALHRNIQDVFNEYGVQIMTPNYVQDTEQPKVVPHDQWYTPPAKPEVDDEK